MSIDSATTLADIVLKYPAATRLFERIGLDYCCGGRKSLADACAKVGLNPDEVIARITGPDPAPAQEYDWNAAPLTALLDHILVAHHEYTHDEMPRLAALMEKVRRVHGGNHPELIQMAHAYSILMDDMLPHLMKEERVLFPYIRDLAEAHAAKTPAPAAPFGTVANPIHMMSAEHDHAGEILRQLRSLSDGYRLPEGACASYRALFHGLEELEHDLMVHIHLENHLLFPRAVDLESARSS